MNQRTSTRIMIAAFMFLVALASYGCSCNDNTPPTPYHPPTDTPVSNYQAYLECLRLVNAMKTSIAESPGETPPAALQTAIAPQYCEGQYGIYGQPLSGQLSNTVTIHTVTPQAPATGCLPPPTLTDPFAGQPAAVSSLTLAWKSDYALQPGEMFDVLVSPDASDLVAKSDTNQPAIVGRTTDKSLPIDLAKWKYAGTLGRFYWSVRIVDSAGVFEDCAAEPASFMLIAPATPTPTRVPTWTPTRVPTWTPTPVPTWTPTPAACLPPPGVYDPPDGRTFAAKSTILRWRSGYALKPDEEFGVLAWPDGDSQPTVLARTRDLTAPIDLLQWAFAGRFGKFFWNVRVQRTDGTVLSCASPALSFTLTGYVPEAGPAGPGKQKPPCPIGIVCP